MATNPGTNTNKSRASLRIGVACAALTLSLGGCMPDVSLETDAQKVSYGMGLEIARAMGPIADSLDLGALLVGLTTGLEDLEPEISAEEIEAARARLFGQAGHSPAEEADEPAAEGEPEAHGEEHDEGGGDASDEAAGEATGEAADTTGSGSES